MRFKSLSAAQMIRDLIMEGGRTDEEIHELVKQKFNFPDDSRIKQVSWYRASLRREGKNPPNRIKAQKIVDATSGMRYSSGQFIKDMLLKGDKHDEEIFILAKNLYGLKDNMSYYIDWYRRRLVQQGHQLPLRRRREPPMEFDLPEGVEIPACTSLSK